MNFATPNLALANMYHNQHMDSCRELIKSASLFIKNLKLRFKFGITPTVYISLMEKYIRSSDIEEINEIEQLRDFSAQTNSFTFWKNEKEVDNVLLDKRSEISDEIADILIFIVYLADALDLDMSLAVTEKIRKNELKYPIDKSKNSNKKYTEL